MEKILYAAPYEGIASQIVSRSFDMISGESPILGVFSIHFTHRRMKKTQKKLPNCLIRWEVLPGFLLEYDPIEKIVFS